MVQFLGPIIGIWRNAQILQQCSVLCVKTFILLHPPLLLDLALNHACTPMLPDRIDESADTYS